MSNLDLTFSDVYAQVGDYLGLGNPPTGTNLTLVQNIIYRAYRQLLCAVHPSTGKQHIWSWLKRRYVLITEQDKWQYNMPSDFDKVIGTPVYGTLNPYPPLVRVPHEHILQVRSVTTTQSFPTVYSVVHTSSDPDTGSLWEMWVWPQPNQKYPIHFQYISSPEKPTATTDLFPGGMRVAECILQLSMAIAEQQKEGIFGIQSQLADKLMSELVVSDDIDTPETVGAFEIFNPRGFKHYGVASVYATDQADPILCIC
jgi:hypothetical protein